MEPKKAEDDSEEDSLTLKNHDAQTDLSSSDDGPTFASDAASNVSATSGAVGSPGSSKQTSQVFARPDSKKNETSPAKVTRKSKEANRNDDELAVNSKTSSLIETFSSEDDPKVEGKEVQAPTSKTGANASRFTEQSKSVIDENDSMSYVPSSDDGEKEEVYSKTTSACGLISGQKTPNVVSTKKPLKAGPAAVLSRNRSNGPSQGKSSAQATSSDDSNDDVQYLLGDYEDDSIQGTLSDVASCNASTAKSGSKVDGSNSNVQSAASFEMITSSATKGGRQATGRSPARNMAAVKRTQPAKTVPPATKKTPAKTRAAKKSPAQSTVPPLTPLPKSRFFGGSQQPNQSKTKKASSAPPSQALKIPFSQTTNATPGRVPNAPTEKTSPKSAASNKRATVRSPRKVNNPIGETKGSKIYARPKLAGLEQDSLLHFEVTKAKTKSKPPTISAKGATPSKKSPSPSGASKLTSAKTAKPETKGKKQATPKKSPKAAPKSTNKKNQEKSSATETLATERDSTQDDSQNDEN